MLKNNDLVNLTIAPNEQKDQREKQIRCQHGSQECKANSYIQCSIASYPEPEKYLPMLGCSFKYLLMPDSPNAVRSIAPNEQVEAVFSNCATRNGLDFRQVQMCYNNNKKDTERQLDSSMFTPVNRNCVPLVEINYESININRLLVEEISKAYDDEVPNEHSEKSNLRTRKDMIRW